MVEIWPEMVVKQQFFSLLFFVTPSSYYLRKYGNLIDGLQVKRFQEKQILGHQKTGSLLVNVLSCPQIGSLSNSTANQSAAQNNYLALGCQDVYFLNVVT